MKGWCLGTGLADTAVKVGLLAETRNVPVLKSSRPSQRPTNGTAFSFTGNNVIKKLS